MLSLPVLSVVAAVELALFILASVGSVDPRSARRSWNRRIG